MSIALKEEEEEGQVASPSLVNSLMMPKGSFIATL